MQSMIMSHTVRALLLLLMCRRADPMGGQCQVYRPGAAGVIGLMMPRGE
jgi:hypothetical protein